MQAPLIVLLVTGYWTLPEVYVFNGYKKEKRLMPTLVFFIDVDNTLIDNDKVKEDLADIVEGRVLLYVHKQQHLDEMMKLYPADHYAMIDDKPQILADSKAIMGDRLTTVFVKQGKYAAGELPANFTPDISVLHIGDLR